MNRKEAIEVIRNEIACVETDCERSECRKCKLVMEKDDILTALNMAADALSQINWISEAFNVSSFPVLRSDVIRCLECNCSEPVSFPTNRDVLYCNLHSIYIRGNDYCSYARKEKE